MQGTSGLNSSLTFGLIVRLKKELLALKVLRPSREPLSASENTFRKERNLESSSITLGEIMLSPLFVQSKSLQDS